MGRCPPKGVRKPQRAGTETEAEGVPKMWRQRRSAWNRGLRDDRGTERPKMRQRWPKVFKIGQKIGLESLLDYTKGGEKAVNRGVSNVPKVKR